MPYPGLLYPEPLLLWQATADPYFHRRQTQFWLRLCEVSGSWYTQGLLEPSERLCWVRGLILNVILLLLSSCLRFSFALGRGVSIFGEIQHSPVDSCSAASYSFGVLAEDEHTSFYSII